MTDPVKQHASIYFKGHITRSLKLTDNSSQLFELADLTIGLLVSPNVQSSLKVHLQDALSATLKEDAKAENNVRITEGLFDDFLANRLKIQNFVGLNQVAHALHHLGGNDPSGVIRVINAFLVGMKKRSRSLELLQRCQPFLELLVGNDFFYPLFNAI